MFLDIELLFILFSRLPELRFNPQLEIVRGKLINKYEEFFIQQTFFKNLQNTRVLFLLKQTLSNELENIF